MSETQSEKAHPTLFDAIHSRAEPHSHEHVHHHDRPLHWRHLYKRPVVRQFVVDDIYVQETKERSASRFELFFDLVFVSIIHFISEWTAAALKNTTDSASSHSSGWAIYAFIVFFYLGWSIWQSVRAYINTSGTDDIFQRLFVLLMMALLLGMTSNATGIELSCGEKVQEFPKRAESEEATYFGADCELGYGWEQNIKGTIAFFLIAKLCRIALLGYYGWYLPRFRRAHVMRAVLEFVGCVLFLPLMFAHSVKLLLILPIIAIALEVLSGYMFSVYLRLIHYGSGRLARHAGKLADAGDFLQAVPAQSMDHTIERTSLFMILVIGEMILNIAFAGAGLEYGAHAEYGRCVLGLFTAYCLHWLYSDADSSRAFLHALRRNRFASVTWTHLHFPLTASLLLASVALDDLVHEAHVEKHIFWLFGGSLAVALLSLAGIGFCHEGLDARRSALIHRYARLSMRLVVVVAFAVLPLSPENALNSVEIQAIYASLLAFLVILETVGKIGSIADHERVQGILRPGQGHEEGTAIGLLERKLGVQGLENVEESKPRLTEIEEGEDDAGMEGEMGELQATRLGARAKAALAF